MNSDTLPYPNDLKPGTRHPPTGTVGTLLLATALLAGSLFLISSIHPAFQLLSALTAMSVWSVVAVLMWVNLAQHHHATFGAANIVTTYRAIATAVLAGFIPVAAQITTEGWLWAIAIVATVTLCLDGLDGYLARKSGLCSAFGARLDMETDALLALVITLLLWQSGKVGIWVLGLGLMRYAFLAASIWLEALKADLFPSMRRKTVCVIQVGALCLMLCPLLSSKHVTAIGLVALVCLLYSFAVDIRWLLLRRA